MRQEKNFLRSTHSLCPVCLAALPAQLVQQGDTVLLQRTCPDHGEFAEKIWKGEPSLAKWHRQKPAVTNLTRQTKNGKGCPHDCGRCPNHGQHACTVLFEITQHCNLRCPVCFAASGGQSSAQPPFFTPLPILLEQLHWIREQAGPVVLQLSGGEPTLHPSLPELVREGRNLFPAVQLNTNGLVLAQQPEMAHELAEAGLSWVFLQFDGTTDAIFTALRGQALLRQKLAAIANCKTAGLSVVLVPTVAPGVNDGDLGNLLRLALSLTPTVRGIHLQPMTTAGRNAFAGSGNRLTLPEVLAKLCEQSEGVMQPEHATPPGCEHERCSFHCRYRISDQGGLIPLRSEGSCCPTPPDDHDDIRSGVRSSYSSASCCAPSAPAQAAACCPPVVATPGTACCAPSLVNLPAKPLEGGFTHMPEREGVDRAIETVLRSWQGPELQKKSGSECEEILPAKLDAFQSFIAKARSQTFSVTCMAFQDAWTADLERLQGCCVHVFAPPARLIPFCAYNLTAADGTPLHREHQPEQRL